MKKTLSEIKLATSKLKEKELRQLLVKIFEEKGFHEVIENHGTQELGKDICFYENSKLDEKIWYACVVKSLDVNQSIFSDIQRQITESFDARYKSHKFGYISIDKVIVITNGVYKDNSKTLISEKFENNKNRILYWDNSDIATELNKLEKIKEIFFAPNIDLIQKTINHKTFDLLNKDNSLKIIYSELNLKNEDNSSNFHVHVKARLKELQDETYEYLKSTEPNSVITKVPTKFIPESIEELLRIEKPILIHGIETSGKTTYLKRIGKDFISKGIDGCVLYFELIKVKEFLLSNSIDMLITETSSNYSNTNYKLVSDKPYLILLDGLDEISSEKERDEVINNILKCTDARKNIKIIFTSRTNDYITHREEKVKRRFAEYELMALTVNNMIEIGTQILSKTGKEGAFIKLLKKDALINAFPKTPLVTILLAIIFKEEDINVNEMPRNITELYNKITDIFLNKWDKSKGISEQFKYQEKSFVIQKIAKHLHENNKKSILEDDLIAFLEELKSKHPIEILKDPVNFVHQFCERSSIIIKDDDEKSFKFFHLTMQEYFTSLILNSKDESILLANFYEDWWLNTSLFYTGKLPHYSDLLNKISEFQCGLPMDGDLKLAYIIHTTKLLQAAHLITEDERLKVLNSVIKVFDDFTKELINEFVIADKETRISKKTILELVLYVRKIFVNFMGVSQFINSLETINNELVDLSNTGLLDITEYCIAYCVSTYKKNSNALYEFSMKENLNPRWYKIIDVDVDIKKLNINNPKIKLKIRSKANSNKKYIQNQFRSRLSLHYKSITGI